MKLLVFGSTGGAGRQLVEQALAQGHAVTAFARNPEKLDVEHPSLKVVQGDVMDLASVERAMQGQEVVLSALGAPASNKSAVRTEGTRQIVRAMEKAGVRRLISISTLGVGDSRDTIPFHYKYILVPLLLRRVFADHETQEDCIRQSRLDWIIVRPAALTNGNRTGVYRHGFPVTDKTIQAKISRSDVADFVLRQVEDNMYLHKTPGVSY
jgi:putative NADH-flavin reductase